MDLNAEYFNLWKDSHAITHLITMQSIDIDLLVCGGGMSGMACASFAAQAGARVLVVEKQNNVGGSSNYSAGMLYVSLIQCISESPHISIR